MHIGCWRQYGDSGNNDGRRGNGDGIVSLVMIIICPRFDTRRHLGRLQTNGCRRRQRDVTSLSTCTIQSAGGRPLGNCLKPIRPPTRRRRSRLWSTIQNATLRLARRRNARYHYCRCCYYYCCNRGCCCCCRVVARCGRRQYKVRGDCAVLGSL